MIYTPIHVIDFEGSRQSGIVEYGVATLLGHGVTATYSRICAAQGTITDRDRQQHGITEAQTESCAPFSDDWQLFNALRQQGPFCAHSVAVESGLLQAVWPCPQQAPNFSELGSLVADWGPWLDTLRLYRRIYPGLKTYKLQELVVLFQLQLKLDELAKAICPPKRCRYHCALYDALASALLLARLFDEPELEDVSLRWLIINSAASESGRSALGQQEFL